MTFGQKIRNRREELGYTQVELAERVHTTQPYISRLERDNFNPSMKMIVNIAIALDISVDYLLFDNGKAEQKNNFLVDFKIR
ncbi:MAG: helix-turn-helix domain-containing protein [Ruminococcus sp.]|nr:helix-turn-helix domain-containing protein [Ruminococcus sp.]